MKTKSLSGSKSLRIRSQEAQEGPNANPEGLGGGRIADGISPHTSLQREALKGLQNRSLQQAASDPPHFKVRASPRALQQAPHSLAA